MIDFLTQPVYWELTGFDLVLIALCLLLAMRGFVRGLVRDAILVAGVVLAVVGARLAGPGAAIVVQPLVGKVFAPFAGAALVFLGITVGAIVAAGLAHDLVKLARLTWLDRAAGLAFGVCLILAFTGIAANMAVHYYPPAGALMHRTLVAQFSIQAMRWIIGA